MEYDFNCVGVKHCTYIKDYSLSLNIQALCGNTSDLAQMNVVVVVGQATAVPRPPQ